MVQLSILKNHDPEYFFHYCSQIAEISIIIGAVRLLALPSKSLRTDNSISNFIKSHQIQIVITLLRLIQHET